VGGALKPEMKAADIPRHDSCPKPYIFFLKTEVDLVLWKQPHVKVLMWNLVGAFKKSHLMPETR
jgi:hypothetical protein